MILETLKNKLLTLGIPGLFLISFLDSAGVPLPGGADLVVMLLSWQRPAHLFLIAVVAALGSVLGSLVLYHIARTKGDAMMSRFPKDKQDRVKEKFRRNDILALLVAMLGPLNRCLSVLLGQMSDGPRRRLGIAPAIMPAFSLSTSIGSGRPQSLAKPRS